MPRTERYARELETHKVWLAKNKDRVRQAKRAWREANRDKIREQQRAGYAANPEKYRAKSRANNAKDPQRHRDDAKRYNALHAEERKAYYRRYAAENPEKRAATIKACRTAKPEKYRALRKAYFHRRRARLLASCSPGVSPADWQVLVRRFGGCCAYCGGSGCEVDHIVPVSKGGRDEIQNVLPACRRCNASKGNRDLGEWLARKGYTDPRVMAA